MISIQFIIPYPELEATVRSLCEVYRSEERLTYKISVASRFQEPAEVPPCDAIIARGLVAASLQGSQAPVISIQVSAFDVLRAIHTCIQKYHPHKIGLVWTSGELFGNAQILRRSCPCELTLYQAAEDSFSGVIQQAARDGCDALIGGYLLKEFLGGQINYTMIDTSRETLRRSIDEAVRTVQAIHRERENLKLYEIVTQKAKEGIVYVDALGTVKLLNSKASLMEYRHGPEEMPTSLAERFPFLCKGYEKALKSRQEQHNCLLKSEAGYYVADYSPVFVSGNISGVIISFQDVTDLQHSEMRIRSQLHTKGLTARYHFQEIYGSSTAMQALLSVAEKYAQTASNVLIYGESGTGKELLAQSIHNASPFRNGPFVAVNCAAISENLIESEMFGYSSGAFTGAVRGGKMGLFELAHNGTLFLDEIAELPYNFQAKLLRVLQEKEIRRIGDDHIIKVNVRIIVAANKPLSDCVQAGTFREDLFYRLNVLQLNIPPLRARGEDIMELFTLFLEKNCTKLGRPCPMLTEDAKAYLLSLRFPGNVRQLRNLAERICVMYSEPQITREMLNAALDEPIPKMDLIADPSKDSLRARKKRRPPEEERSLIEQLLTETNRNIREVSELLGISRSTLWRKMKQYQLQ